MVGAFRQGLKETGYVEGQKSRSNIAGQRDNTISCRHWLPILFVNEVSVIAATSTPANLVAKSSTTTIPIVFTTGGDPVQLGLVASSESARR